MQVDDELVLRLARLAKLELPPNGVAALRHDLEKILAMVEKLDDLDLDGVEPLRYVTEINDAQRPDRVGDHLHRDRALAGAPEHTDGFFKVPRVIPEVAKK